MKLYIYDHCPYCIKARMIFGLKAVPFELITLLNDDIDTPTKMIGKKMAPILEKDDGTYMPESMDIVKYIDDNFGGEKLLTGEIKNAFHNPKLAEWAEKVKPVIYRLAMPRWVNANLEEFRTQSAKDYFTNNKEASLGAKFSDLFKQSPDLIKQANELLAELGKILMPSGKLIDFGKTEFVNGEFSEDDIHLFPSLRSLSIVEGIVFPDVVKKYAANLSSKSKVSLHFGIAL